MQHSAQPQKARNPVSKKLPEGFVKKGILRCICDPLKTMRRIKLEQAIRFQRDLKVLPEMDAAKLDAAMVQFGFLTPLFLWHGHDAILDGTQRRDRLEANGWNVEGGIPVVDIEATDEEDAAKKLLLIASRYGEVTQDGLADFGAAYELNLGEFTLPAFADIDWGAFLPGDPDAFPEPEAPNGGQVKMVRSRVDIPPAVWLQQRDEVIAAMDTVLAKFGGVAEWAD